MTDEYNPKSCNALEKPFYHPIEVAIRWCNLIKNEEIILQQVPDNLVPSPGLFPQWPCLRANAEKVLDAILSNDIPYGRDGRTVNPGEQVARHRLTVRHSDLKIWMQKHYPDQKPDFLFDEIEQNTHSAMSKDAFLALQAERDALKLRIENATDAYRKLKQDRDNIATERDKLHALVGKAFTTTERNTLLTMIAAVCNFADIQYQARGAAQRIMEMTDEIGAHIDDETIRNVLGKIPDALEVRLK
ncbi:hypothetical protein [Fluoribacter gormanii]|uniref:hypothetical protein n=1 Tax=Fluoribacter gormanii TaxID=464 RepID=UPI001040FD2F|nr:hypothetical protein [Fluoribacter gormanii]